MAAKECAEFKIKNKIKMKYNRFIINVPKLVKYSSDYDYLSLFPVYVTFKHQLNPRRVVVIRLDERLELGEKKVPLAFF